MTYLEKLLKSQDLSISESQFLQHLRNQVQVQLSELPGNPRFYYAGSYGKKTMIRARYDLDIVVYWPHSAPYTIQDIYCGVGEVLQKHWSIVNSKTVSWELPFDGGFHIDVVPGRALDDEYYEANLYRTDTETTLKTSLKKHIETVRTSGRIPVIRLVKLWRERKQVPFQKSFLLELMTIEGCKGKTAGDYHGQFFAALTHIRNSIMSCTILDPANSNNLLSDDLSLGVRKKIKDAADQAITAKNWNDIFNY